MNMLIKTTLASLVMASFMAHTAAAENTFRVGSDMTSPPYIYFDQDKKPAGFDAEFMQALAQAGKFNITFIDTRFENLILGLNSNKFDVVASSMFIKPERAKQVDFIPYANAGLGFLVRNGSDFKPESADQLCGKRVGLIKGAAYIESIKNACAAQNKTVDIREFPTSAEATQAVMAGNVEVQADDSAVLKVAVDKTNGRVSISSKKIIFPVVLGIAISKKHPEIKSELEAAFSQIKTNGVYNTLLNKYNLSASTDADYKKAIGE